jgi:hypothetical protein
MQARQLKSPLKAFVLAVLVFIAIATAFAQTSQLSPTGAGVQGTGTYGGYFTGTPTSSTNASFGVYASGSGSGYGGYFVGGAYGVYATGDIFGISASGANGVVGIGSNVGVAGSASSVGVSGIGNGFGGIGVYGLGKSADFFAAGAGVHYGSLSSSRWMENTIPIAHALEKILALRGVSFGRAGNSEVGMIGEEVRAVIPEIVINDSSDPNYTVGMDYSRLGPLLVEAIKAQQIEIQQLKEQIHRLSAHD